jgi:hypothetical protein
LKRFRLFIRRNLWNRCTVYTNEIPWRISVGLSVLDTSESSTSVFQISAKHRRFARGLMKGKALTILAHMCDLSNLHMKWWYSSSISSTFSVGNGMTNSFENSWKLANYVKDVTYIGILSPEITTWIRMIRTCYNTSPGTGWKFKIVIPYLEFSVEMNCKQA